MTPRATLMVTGRIPRAIATGQVLGPRQHQPIELLVRPGRVEFRRRDPGRLDLELWNTEIGPALVTSIDQTILDLSGSPFPDPAAPRAEAVRALMGMTTPERVADLALRVRGRSAWRRARWSTMLSDDDRRRVRAQFGADDDQVRRDHLISHLLAVLSKDMPHQPLLRRNSAARAFLPSGRLACTRLTAAREHQGRRRAGRRRRRGFARR